MITKEILYLSFCSLIPSKDVILENLLYGLWLEVFINLKLKDKNSQGPPFSHLEAVIIMRDIAKDLQLPICTICLYILLMNLKETCNIIHSLK
jgi:hypothetical protein